jgi:hypothetical protein
LSQRRGLLLLSIALLATSAGEKYGLAALSGPGVESVAAPRVGAPIEVESFRYARGIPAGAPGLAALLLDAAALAHAAPGLGDVRIADGSGRQIPYVLERRDEPLSLALPALEKASRSHDPAGVSRYAVKLPYGTLPAAHLVLATKARMFERMVRLLQPEGASPGRRTAAERTLAVVSWRHAAAESPSPPLVLELPERSGDRFEVVVDEGDNAPLPLDAPRLLLPSYRLRYFHPAGGGPALRLLYGQPGLAPPRYDLSLYGARLLGDSARQVSPLPEPAAGGASEATAVPGLVFWLALGGAVLALVFLLARLLRHPRPR